MSRAEIWAQPDEIRKRVLRVQSRGRALQRAVERGDVPETRAVLKQLGGACKACHKDFRDNEYSAAP